ncbi:hydroxyisourate hydrolase [Microbispora sp. ZYX-F-249]|uniref:5-hydroxyisourate hydrolase n=1 Tax=Microbispora maris TaxID=3144104 RepID=A0ABV0AQP3_9ACTN
MNVALHVLDGTYGRPAAGVRVRLERIENGLWLTEVKAETDHEGRIAEWRAHRFERGLHRIVFETDPYFVGLGLTAAYPEISAMFRMHDDADTYQVRVLLSPFSYSVYFGSHS